MKKVELIPKTSTLNDIIGPWTDSGRTDNRRDGQFVFENVANMYVSEGVIFISIGEVDYYYNMADFYRVKVIGN